MATTTQSPSAKPAASTFTSTMCESAPPSLTRVSAAIPDSIIADVADIDGTFEKFLIKLTGQGEILELATSL